MWRNPTPYVAAAAATAWFVAAFLLGGAFYSIFHPHPVNGVILLFAAIPPAAFGLWLTEHLRGRHRQPRAPHGRAFKN